MGYQRFIGNTAAENLDAITNRMINDAEYQNELKLAEDQRKKLEGFLGGDSFLKLEAERQKGVRDQYELAEEERKVLREGGYLPNFQEQLDAAYNDYLRKLPDERENAEHKARVSGDQQVRLTQAQGEQQRKLASLQTSGDLFKDKLAKYAQSLSEVNQITAGWLNKSII